MQNDEPRGGSPATYVLTLLLPEWDLVLRVKYIHSGEGSRQYVYPQGTQEGLGEGHKMPNTKHQL